MSQHSIHPPVAHDVSCVLYAPDTGKIVFTHRVTVLGNAARPSEHELEKEARALLRHDMELYAARSADENLAALIVPTESLRPGHTYAVNIKDRTLIARPRSRQAE
jgi:hypothetical protein